MPTERVVLAKEMLEVCDAEAHDSFCTGIDELSRPSPTVNGSFSILTFGDVKDDRLLLKVSLKASTWEAILDSLDLRARASTSRARRRRRSRPCLARRRLRHICRQRRPYR